MQTETQHFFTTVIYTLVLKTKVPGSGKHLHSNLILASEVRAYLRGLLHLRSSTLLGKLLQILD